MGIPDDGTETNLFPSILLEGMETILLRLAADHLLETPEAEALEAAEILEGTGLTDTARLIIRNT